jgi:glutathione S-transferase
MKYYGFWRSLAACRVRIALALKGIAAEEISVNLMQGEQLKPDYKAINPLGVVPSLVRSAAFRIAGDHRVPG